MKKIILLFVLILSTFVSQAQDDNEVLDYIDRFKNLAISEQVRTGVPAAIKLAQGIYETGAGTSDLATNAHNHFGIKCKTTWKGETYLHDDDKKQECFRKYATDEDSYKDHSDFLKGNLRYSPLFKLETTDYVGWANGLKRAGYATNPAYVKKVVQMIEKYNLQQYSFEALASPMPVEPKSSFRKPAEVIPNQDAKLEGYKPAEQTVYQGLKGFWGKKGQALLGAASDLNIRYAKLLALNDLDNAPLPHDMFIYTERKRKIGMTEFHYVAIDEDMQLIAQREAIGLDYLYKYNNLRKGEEPEVGEKLYLRYMSVEGTPKIKVNFLATLNNENRPIEVKEQAVNVVKELPEKIEAPKEEIVIEKEEVLLKEEPKVVEEEYTATKPTSSSKTINEVAGEPEVVESTMVEAVAENAKIIDAEKAQLMDQLLNSNPIDGSPKKEEKFEEEPVRKVQVKLKEEEKIATDEVAKAEQIPVKETIVENQIEIIEQPVQLVKMVEQISPTKNYNESGVDDSTKDLKRKFDQIIYAPKPPKRIDTTAKLTTEKQIVIAKPEVKKVEAKKVEAKKSDTTTKKAVEKTKQLKKETKIDAKNASKPNSKLNAQNKKEAVKKELINKAEPKASEVKKKSDAKKSVTKEKAETKKLSDTKKKEAAKKVDEKKKSEVKKKK